MVLSIVVLSVLLALAIVLVARKPRAKVDVAKQDEAHENGADDKILEKDNIP